MVWLFVLLCIIPAWQVKGQYGYPMMHQPAMAMAPQPMAMAPQPMAMAPQPMMMPMQPMGYGRQPPPARVPPRPRGGYPAGGLARAQKSPWSECSKTCGVDSVRTRTYTPCDTSVSSCMEREGCMVPECGITKVFGVGDEVKLPCHAEASRKNYKGQWFSYDESQHSWKYVTLEPKRKYMDKRKNLVIASAKLDDQGTYKCNLKSQEGTIVGETIWHFSVNSQFNMVAAGGGGGVFLFVIILILIGVCYFRYKKMKDGQYETKRRDKGRDEGGGAAGAAAGAAGYDYGDTSYGDTSYGDTSYGDNFGYGNDLGY